MEQRGGGQAARACYYLYAGYGTQTAQGELYVAFLPDPRRGSLAFDFLTQAWDGTTAHMHPSEVAIYVVAKK